MTRCPTCGQRTMVRYGVRLSPRKADFFDMIERVTKVGARVSLDTLADVFYPSLPRPQGRNTAKQHIYQINELLEETDFVIRCAREDGYRLEKR